MADASACCCCCCRCRQLLLLQVLLHGLVLRSHTTRLHADVLLFKIASLLGMQAIWGAMAQAAADDNCALTNQRGVQAIKLLGVAAVCNK